MPAFGFCLAEDDEAAGASGRGGGRKKKSDKEDDFEDVEEDEELREGKLRFRGECLEGGFGDPGDSRGGGRPRLRVGPWWVQQRAGQAWAETCRASMGQNLQGKHGPKSNDVGWLLFGYPCHACLWGCFDALLPLQVAGGRLQPACLLMTLPPLHPPPW